MQGNDAIEVVPPLGGGISEVTLIPDAYCRSCEHCECIGGTGSDFSRRQTAPIIDVALFVRRIEIPAIGRNGEIAGVLCRYSPRSQLQHSRSLRRWK
jgi:hypothetical protein